MMAFVDFETDDRPTITVRRKAIELTGTAIRAIAVCEFPRLDFPKDIRHPFPPPLAHFAAITRAALAG
jgi:hypothetical protein